MLAITIPHVDEAWDDRTGEFIKPVEKDVVLQLEHSLISLEKWEEKWKKPFLGREKKTPEEALDYIRCMTVLPKVVDPIIYNYIPESEMQKIDEYLKDSHTATTFRKDPNIGVGSNGRVVTAEVIYYWMFTFNIPMECQKWNLNRLITLIRVFSAENAPKKKLGKNKILADNRQLNAARRAKYGTRG